MSQYETQKALNEYLLFHYGSLSEVMPFNFGPKEAYGFPIRCIQDCLKTDAIPANARALDLGCAVGRSTFALAKYCQEVLGIDYSQQFIHAANTIKTTGSMPYEIVEEGCLTVSAMARIPEDVDVSRVAFEVGDAMNLRDTLGEFDVVFTANLIDRLPDPRLLLQRLPDMVKNGGQLIIISPYTWLEEYTSPDKWLCANHGQPTSTLETLHQILDANFSCDQVTDIPFLIREHARKYQWSVSQGSRWIRH